MLALIALVIAYLVIAWLVIRRQNGRKKYIMECVGIQIIPLLLSLCVFAVVPKLQRTPKGTINAYEQAFSDIQRLQIISATRNGIEPFEEREKAKITCMELRKEGLLTKISSNSDYHVRNLKHSLPYVVPRAEELLRDIATEFQMLSGTNARFEITSVLRTKEDVIKLQNKNSNATKNSCHLYGTTFDISYASFKVDILNPKSNKELREALSQTLYTLRKEGRCYVKFENKQMCYHITVR